MYVVECIFFFFFFSSRRRHTRLQGDWSSDVCSSDLAAERSRHSQRAGWKSLSLHWVHEDIRFGGAGLSAIRVRSMFDLYEEFRRLISALDNNHIDYALCGGLAMAVYDHARATIDIDILILSE